MYAKKVLNGMVHDEKVFSLLYEPDNVKDWMFDDSILEQSNPLALEVPEIMEDLKNKRQVAIEVMSKRENFVTKHCNIVFQGVGTASYVDINDLQRGKIDSFDWRNRSVWCGLDLSLTNDNTSVSFVTEEDGKIIAESFAFIPEDRIPEKNRSEKIKYEEFIEAGKCFACGDMTIDYGFVEDFILQIERKFGVTIQGIAYDRYNALSTAQRLERESSGFKVVEMKQHSSVLHAPTKLIREKIMSGDFHYTENKLLEINFQNSRVVEDNNRNLYVNKKKSNGKVDMVVSLINAVALMQIDVIFNADSDWGAMVI
jgi:phage terminase large subunit-like protein